MRVGEDVLADPADRFSYGQPTYDPAQKVVIEEASVTVTLRAGTDCDDHQGRRRGHFLVENSLKEVPPLPEIGGDVGSLLGVGTALALAGTVVIVVRTCRPSAW
jgi:hypothetical protein